jgi:hypothetical protein
MRAVATRSILVWVPLAFSIASEPGTIPPMQSPAARVSAEPVAVPMQANGPWDGDLDHDCDVDLLDFARFLVNYTGPDMSGGCCWSNATCDLEDFCLNGEGDCVGPGRCAPRSQACPELWDPVCGCDGQTYANACYAAAAAVSIDYPGECGGPHDQAA